MAARSPLFSPTSKQGLGSAMDLGGDPARLEAQLRVLVRAVEQSPVSIVVTDAQGRIEYVNPKFCHTTGYTMEEVLGKTPRILKSGCLDEAFYQDLWRTILAGQEWHGMFHNRTKGGELLWELGSISPIRDEAGVVTHFVSVKEDITEIKRMQDQMDHLAHHDQLTGLPNRTLFYDRLKQALVLARRREHQLALFYLDLDGFKAVNDRHGHEQGDHLLTMVAQRLGSCVRESDTVARMGGDEFTVLLMDPAGAEAAQRVARLILELLARPFVYQGITSTIGVSIGISFYPQDGDDPDQLLLRADAAMYQVKNGSKNQFRFWASQAQS
jgi:diguanylate cyclase (GGDEF)-like protein/PAS domain S-box-containing protein